MPEERFKIKPVKTKYKKNELNPFYLEEFKMYVRTYIAMQLFHNNYVAIHYMIG